MVIKTQEYKENDKLVWLYTEKLGKVSAIARGARKGNSKLMAPTLQFSYGNFVLYRGKSLYTINEADLIDSFQDFMVDLETLTYTSYLNELIDIALVDEESNRELFRLLITTYYLIRHKVGDIEVLVRAFELNLLKETGYGLILDRCVKCRGDIKNFNYIELDNYGYVCDKCRTSSSIKVSPSTYNILRYINKLPLEKINRLKLTKENKGEIYDILSKIIAHNYSRRPKSLDMFNYLTDKE